MIDPSAFRHPCLEQRFVTRMSMHSFHDGVSSEHSELYAQRFHMLPSRGYRYSNTQRYPYPQWNSCNGLSDHYSYSRNNFVDPRPNGSVCNVIRPQGNITKVRAPLKSYKTMEQHLHWPYWQFPSNSTYQPSTNLPSSSNSSQKKVSPNQTINQPPLNTGRFSEKFVNPQDSIGHNRENAQGLNCSCCTQSCKTTEQHLHWSYGQFPSNSTYQLSTNLPSSSNSSQKKVSPNQTINQPPGIPLNTGRISKKCSHCCLKFVNPQDSIEHNRENAQGLNCNRCTKRFTGTVEYLDHLIHCENERHNGL